jgi:hypothetical protein
MTEDESQPLTELPQDEFHDRVSESAMGTLVIAVLDQRDHRARGSEHM